MTIRSELWTQIEIARTFYFRLIWGNLG